MLALSDFFFQQGILVYGQALKAIIHEKVGEIDLLSLDSGLCSLPVWRRDHVAHRL